MASRSVSCKNPCFFISCPHYTVWWCVSCPRSSLCTQKHFIRWMLRRVLSSVLSSLFTQTHFIWWMFWIYSLVLISQFIIYSLTHVITSSLFLPVSTISSKTKGTHIFLFVMIHSSCLICSDGNIAISIPVVRRSVKDAYSTPHTRFLFYDSRASWPRAKPTAHHPMPHLGTWDKNLWSLMVLTNFLVYYMLNAIRIQYSTNSDGSPSFSAKYSS